MKYLLINLPYPGQIPQAALNAIRNSLKCNKGLKEINIRSKAAIGLFGEDFSSEISFKFTEFDAFNHRLDEPSSLQSFKKFLVTQKDSLEVLRIRGWEAIVGSMETILSMPRLKKLCLGNFYFENTSNATNLAAGVLSQNFSVATLDLDFVQIENIDTLKVILSAFPNIETLIVCIFSDETANVISEKCKSLKNLSVEFFKAQHIADKNLYRNLENFTYSWSVCWSSRRLFNELGVKSINSTQALIDKLLSFVMAPFSLFSYFISVYESYR